MIQSGSSGFGSQDLEHAICSPRTSKRQQMMETGQLLFEHLAEKPLEASESKPRVRAEYADEVVSLALGVQDGAPSWDSPWEFERISTTD